MAAVSIDHALQLAIEAHKARRLEDAERLYRAILQVQPKHADANHNLGVLALLIYGVDAALPFLAVALDVNPNQGQYWVSYIDALIKADQIENARSALLRGRQIGLAGEAVDRLAVRLPKAPAANEAGTSSKESGARSSSSHKLGPKKKRKKSLKAEHHARQSPTQDEIDALVSAFGNGRYSQAERLAMTLTQALPNHPMGWKALGAALKQTGRTEQALVSMRRSVELAPQDAEAHSNLGIALNELGRFVEAAASYRQALALKPDSAQTHNNLGATLIEIGRLTEAAASCRQAVALKPDFAEAHSNLGLALKDLGLLAQAEASCRQAIMLQPDYARAHGNLGNTFKALGRLSETEASYRQALVLKPDYAEAHSNLGATLIELGRLPEAEASYRQAIALQPDFAEAHSNLGAVLIEMGRPAEAEESCRQAIVLKPDNAEAYCNLGFALNNLGLFSQAETSYRRAIALKPDYAKAHGNLGATLIELGRFSEAEASCRQALALQPDYAKVHSNLLLSMCYVENLPAAVSLAEAIKYGAKVSRRVTKKYTSWRCPQESDKLRVGFVSGDLRNHPVGYFLEGLLSNIDQTKFELIAYVTNPNTDELTERIKPCFKLWQPLFGKSDEAAATMIHDDGIQILIDLAGHTAHNRLPVFAYKPAPVQVSWLGYFATTGLAEMDYLLGDPHVTPASEEQHFSERIWRLPETYFCFTPPSLDIKVGDLPALSNGYVTFGCFNNLSKMNDAVVALWANVLHAVKDSRLFLKTKQFADSKLVQMAIQRFTALGIQPHRLIIEGPSSRSGYFESYNRVDIALDPFPFPGGTTSAEGLWMGVPVITKKGDRFIAHNGETIAQNTGRSEWIAQDDKEYVEKAIFFASDPSLLAKIRSGLRSQVLSSHLFDSKRFSNNFALAMTDMWLTHNGHVVLISEGHNTECVKLGSVA